MISIYCGNVEDLLSNFRPDFFDACLCDPPYGLKFMGKSWDHGVPSAAIWKLVKQTLKPGAPILAFGGTRTYHRLACAIEDAGFEIFDSILGSVWIQGQGFPKGLSLEKTIREKARAQAQHDVRFMRGTYLSSAVYACKECGQVLLKIVQKQSTPTQETTESGHERGEESVLERWSDLETPERKLLRCPICTMSHGILADGAQGQIHSRAPVGNGSASRAASDKSGGGPSHRSQSEQQRDREPAAVCLERRAQTFRGYNVCLKPSWEPVVFARKPLSGTYAENCIEHGCGGLNINGSRIGSDTARGDRYHGKPPGGSHSMQIAGPREKTWQVQAGRYPTNLILSHHPDCSPLGTRRVPPRGGDIKPNSKGTGPRSNQVYGQDASDRGEWTAYKGEDGLEEVEAWECHPECPVAALDRQSGDRSSTRKGNPNNPKHGRQAKPAAYAVGDGSEGRDYRDSGGASRFFYASKVSTSERNRGLPAGVVCDHPTLKPIDLCRYLATLILPPPRFANRPRNLLIPFSGAGSEIIGATIAGWESITAIEKEENYIKQACYRIKGHTGIEATLW